MSSVSISPCLRLSRLLEMFDLKRSTKAKTRRSLCQLEYFPMCITFWFMLLTKNEVRLFCCSSFPRVAALLSFRSSISFLGQFSDVLLRKFGPFHHISQFTKSLAVFPRVAMSAGFSFHCTYLHWFGTLLSWISLTRLATKGLKLRLSLWIHQSAFILSDLNTTSHIFIMSARTMLCANRTPKTAAIDSRRGIRVAFHGATLVFELTKRISMLESFSLFLTCIVAAYTSSDASTNVRSTGDCISSLKSAISQL